ncbi:MAG TPA: SusD/RagB family nutrient-binding outer membrane lipoprotein [Bacteroidales bacterium]|nr:SusD/RagB family nutrient-binding outer membrane lipoprotein [Bacteroidales bacterium]
MKIYKYIIILLLSGGLFSCELPDNLNPKMAAVVPASSIFTMAQVQLVEQVNSIDQNQNISRLLAQYNSQTTYYGESQWNFYDRGLPDEMWETLYRDVLLDFKEARRLIDLDISLTTQVKANQKAIIDIMEVYAYHVLVDCNGDIPYTEALSGRDNPTPAYDDAATIYADLISRLTADAAALDNTHPSIGEADVMYNGDVDSWSRFANSLQIRLAMRIADVSPALSESAAEAAISRGVFTDQSESAVLVYFGITPHVNSVYNYIIQQGRRDFVASNTIIDTMNAINDPRRSYYFTTVDGEYIGGNYGYRNVFGQCSHFASEIKEPDYPAILLDYVEVEFLLAEAAARGYDVGGGSEVSHYNDAVTQSILAWGGTNAEASTYLSQTEIGYSTGSTAGDFRKKIGLQKWIALYNRGLEGWAEWRRLDSPIFNIARNKTIDDIPMRMPYPYNEDNLNLANYNAGSAAIGGDLVSTKLFWDIY